MAIEGALPTAPTGLAADESARQEYLTALTKTLGALEQRGGINLWNVASQFLNPGRTGSFGEAVSNVAGSVGKDVEKQQEMALPIAQMRASVAGQKFTLENQAKALQLLGDNLGIAPGQVTSTLSSGNLSKNQLAQLSDPRLYLTVSELYPQLGERMTKLVDMQEKVASLNIKQGQADTDLRGKVAEYGPGFLTLPTSSAVVSQTNGLGFNLPTPNARISSPFGTRQDPTDKSKTAMHGGIDFAAKQGEPVQAVLPGTIKAIKTEAGFGNKIEIQHKDGSISYYAHLDKIDPSLKPGDQIPEGTLIGTVGSTGKSTGPHVEFGIRDKNGQPVDPTALFKSPQSTGVQVASTGNEGLPLKVQTEVQKTNVSELNKPVIEKRNTITTNYGTATTNKYDNDLQELYSITKRSGDKIFGILNKEGTIAALKAGAQEGITMGQFGSISLPVQKMAEKYNLSPAEQDDLRRAQQLMAEIFFSNGAQYKGVLGPQISNTDANLMREPGVTAADSNKVIQHWIKNQTLFNEQRKAISSTLDAYDTKYKNASTDPGAFFKSNEYKDIFKTYDGYFKQLRENNPLTRTKD
jgi:murein DD-endopeptidase MepM/ murein hydrolase activator NlpD